MAQNIEIKTKYLSLETVETAEMTEKILVVKMTVLEELELEKTIKSSHRIGYHLNVRIGQLLVINWS